MESAKDGQKWSAFDTTWTNLFNRSYALSEMKHNDDERYVVNEEKYFSNLAIEKADLNRVKSYLNSVDIVQWRKHTSNKHKFALVPFYLRNQINAELVTQAWTKFYTILSTFSLVKQLSNNETFYSVHLCEAPGAFIASLNHYIKNNFSADFKWDWTATTLNPYYEGNDMGQMIPDDRFIIETLPQWDFGIDFTGNVMTMHNLNYMKEKFLNTSVHLVTADGSIDCSDDPGEQENNVAMLLLWETVTALSILSEDGCFVLKMFTVFEKCTISLLYLLYTLFSHVTLSKPGPSKPGNSEVYVICQGFHRNVSVESLLLQKFVMSASQQDLSLCIVDFSKVSKQFLESINDYVEESCSQQKEAINSNIRTFERLTAKENRQLQQLKRYLASRFLEEFRIKQIDTYVSPIFMMKCKQGSFCGKKYFYDKNYTTSHKTGSLNERSSCSRNKISSPVDTDKKNMENDVDESEHEWFETCIDFTNLEFINIFAFIVGKKIQCIYSSNICRSTLLLKYIEEIQSENIFTEQTFQNNLEHLEIFLQTVRYSLTSLVIITRHSLRDVISSYLEERNTVYSYVIDTENEILQEIDNTVTILCQLSCLNTSDKLEQVKLLLCTLKRLQQHHNNVIIQFNGLILTNFWSGLFLLFSRCFKKMLYHIIPQTGSCLSILIFTGASSDFTVICKQLLDHFEALVKSLMHLKSNTDVLHVLPVYNLMQSQFRDYLTLQNEHFITYSNK